MSGHMAVAAGEAFAFFKGHLRPDGCDFLRALDGQQLLVVEVPRAVPINLGDLWTYTSCLRSPCLKNKNNNNSISPMNCGYTHLVSVPAFETPTSISNELQQHQHRGTGIKFKQQLRRRENRQPLSRVDNKRNSDGEHLEDPEREDGKWRFPCLS